MKEKLIIKNFGPIKDVELEIGRVTVLIGEQATGKSTIAKVLAVCQDFSYIVTGYDNDPLEISFSNGLGSWGLREFIKGDTFIQYDCKHYSFTAQARISGEIDNEHGSIASLSVLQNLKPISQEFKRLLSEFEKIMPRSLKNDLSDMSLGWSIPTSFFLNDVASVLDRPILFPTERGLQSIFSLGKTSVQNISDFLFNVFAETDRIARSFKAETEIEPLDIHYKNINGYGYIRKKGENAFYSLENGASGYQTAIPIVLTVKYYLDSKKEKTFLIEEPELSLFPAAQRKLVSFLIDKSIHSGNSKLLLTTHSPYILTSLNNLMSAFRIGQAEPIATKKIIEEKYWLDSQNVRVYMISSDGYCVDIIDNDEGLIEAEKIDSVSQVLNKEFDDLLNIEFTSI